MTDKLTLELDYDSANLLLHVIREGLDNGCRGLEVDDEDKVMDVRDALLNWLTDQQKAW
jgi:hypothetical protein